MHQPVAEAGHAPKRHREVGGDNAVLVQHRENVAVVFGRAVMFGGNNVIAEIQAGGDGGLQIIFRTADFGGV